MNFKKLAAVLIIVCIVASSSIFFFYISMNSSNLSVSNEKQKIYRDFTVPTVYINGVMKVNKSTIDNLTGQSGKYGFNANVVVNSTGILEVSNATLYFLEDSFNPVTLIVYGSLILDNATLTVTPDKLYPDLYFTINSFNGATLNFKNSKVYYPGWFNVSNDAGNVYFNNTIFDKVSDQTLNLLSSYGFNGDINALKSGPTPFFNNSIIHMFNASFPQLFDYPAGKTIIPPKLQYINTATSLPIILSSSSPQTIVGSKYMIPPNPYNPDMTFSNITVNIKYSVTTGYDNSSQLVINIIGPNQVTVQGSSYLLTVGSNATQNSIGKVLMKNVDIVKFPVSLQSLMQGGTFVLSVTPPASSTITINNVYLNLSVDQSIVNFGFYRFNFNAINSEIYGKDVFISANYNPNTGNPQYNAIYLNHSKAYFLNLTVTNSATKIDPPYIIDPSSSMYISRYAEINVKNYDGTPISNAILNATAYSNLPAPYNNAFINGYNKNSNSYFSLNQNTTNSTGTVIVALLSDIIKTQYWPNSLYVGNYNFTVWTLHYSKILTRFTASLSYFPALTVQSNTMYRNVTVSIPNIAASSISIPLTMVYGKTYNLNADFMVYGANINNVPVKFTIYSITLWTTVNMVANQSNTATVPWTVSLSKGNYTITATANPNSTILESTYSDNSISALTEIYPNIDLGVSSLTITGTALDQPVSVNFNIANYGTEDASNVSIAYQITGPSGFATLSGSFTETVNASQTVSLSTSFTPNVSGAYQVQIWIYYYWDYNQANNYMSKTLTFGMDFAPVSGSYKVISNISATDNIVTMQLSAVISVTGTTIQSAPAVEVEFIDLSTGRTIGVAYTEVIGGQLVALLNTTYFVYGTNYNVQINVNPNHNLTELNYNNNILNFTITLPAFSGYSVPQSITIMNGTSDTVYINSTLMNANANNVVFSLSFLGYSIAYTQIYNNMTVGQTTKLKFQINTSSFQNIMQNKNSINLWYQVTITYSQLNSYFYIVKLSYITVLEKPSLSLSLNIVTNNYVTNTSKIAEGLQFNVFANVINTGGWTAYGNITLNISDGTSILYNKVIGSNLASGKNVSVTLPYQATAIGTHTLTGVITYTALPQKTTALNTQSASYNVILPSIVLRVVMSGTNTISEKQSITFMIYALNENATKQRNTNVYVPGVEVTFYAGSIIKQATTNSNGYVGITITFPSAGTYPISTNYYYQGYKSPTTTQPETVTVKPLPTVLPWLWIIIVVIIVAVAGFFGYAYMAYKKEEENMMVCGNCGSLVPADSTKCPVCSVAFEKEKVKCSSCESWIPVDAPYCSNCGSIFLSSETEEFDYLSSMKRRYEEFLKKFRLDAEKDLGEKYTEPEFARWWQNNPEYISFEAWLKREEEQKKESIKCPVCGSSNPKTANVCVVCGTPLQHPEEEKPEEKPPETPTPAVPPTPPRPPEQPPAMPPPAEEAPPTAEEGEKPGEMVIKRRLIRKIIPGKKEEDEEKK